MRPVSEQNHRYVLPTPVLTDRFKGSDRCLSQRQLAFPCNDVKSVYYIIVARTCQCRVLCWDIAAATISLFETHPKRMLNLYAVLGLAIGASDDDIVAAIDQAEHNHQLPSHVLQDAKRHLLVPLERVAYDKKLKDAMQNGLAYTDWHSRELVPVAQLPAVQQPAYLVPIHHQTPHHAYAQYIPTEEHAKMKKRHWLVFVLCSVVTLVLVAVLWQMAQVQKFQSEQITALQKMTAERRLPEDWPTWEQLNGETFLHAKEQAGTKLMIYKNATQDLPVMLLPSKKRIDCQRRGNQYCDVTFVFDGQDPQTFEAQIVGSTLVFNDNKQLPVLMHQLSEASSIRTDFPKGKDLPSMTFERKADNAAASKETTPTKARAK